MHVPIAVVVVVAALGQSAPPRDAPPSAAAGTATISGRITDKESGRPLSRAAVFLTSAGGERTWQTFADGDGRYVLENVPSGKYALVATPGELRMTHLRQAFGQPAPLGYLALPSPALELRSGDVRVDLDFALTRALAIEGRVVDGDGEPMAAVSVNVIRAEGSLPVANAQTDDRGEFRVFGVPAGRYRVCAEPEVVGNRAEPGGRPVRTCHPAAAGEAGAADVLLGAADATGIDIRIATVGTLSIAGSIVDAAGRPLDRAFVMARSIDNRAYTNHASEAGRFQLTGLTPGRYLVSASIGGPRFPEDPRPPDREREAAYAVVDVAGDMTGVALATVKAAKVPGRLRFAGTPRPNTRRLRIAVQLRPSPEYGRLWDRGPSPAPVGDDLRFELSGVFGLPQIVYVEGVPDGWTLESVHHAGRDVTDVPADFSTAPADVPLEITLTNRIAEPTFHVVDEGATPPPMFHVVMLPADPARWGRAAFVPGTSMSADGTVKPGAVRPGEYLVAALSFEDIRMLHLEPDRISSVAAVADRITLSAGQRGTIELRLKKLPSRPQ